MRAIDADKLKEHIDKSPALPDGNFAGNHSALKALINMQPTVEPERKRGKWIVYEDCEGKTRTCTCNLCGYETGEYTWENPNYCENCGARMEVEE